MSKFGGVCLCIGASLLIQTAAAKNYCERKSVYDVSLEEVLASENRLSFSNPPGAWGVGDCWWHTAMQRYVYYLADFQPDKPMASRDYYLKAIRDLAKGDRVVAIPGFKDLDSFSTFHEQEFKRVLSEMHTRDIFALGLISLFRLPPDPNDRGANRRAYQTMVKQLDEHKFPVITFRSSDSLSNHAYLVFAKQDLNDREVEFQAIDSDMPKYVATFRWDKQRERFDYIGIAVTRSNEYPAYERAFKKYCKR